MVMTISPNGQPRLDADKSKAHAKAVKTRLNELGVDIKLSHAYEALASSHGFRNWATMSAGLSGTSGGSITIAKEGHARYSFTDGSRSFGKDISLTFQQCRNHVEFIGRKKRSHAISSVVAQAIRIGAGAIFAEAGGTSEPVETIIRAAERAGRTDDVRIIDFNAPATDKPLRYTPFSTCTGDEMAEMLAGFVDVEGEEGRHWKGRSKAMLSGICEILTWARDNGSVDVTAGEINKMISFRDLIDFTDHEEYPDIPSDVRSRVSKYLSTLPGFNAALGHRQSQTTLDQHGYAEMQLCKVLSELDYAHARVLGSRPRIFGRRPRHLDMDTVVNENLIFIVRMPPLELAPDERAFPGRLILGDAHRALKRRIGSMDQDGKPPFFLAFDHFDAAASRRDDLGDLVSDLTAANACLLAGSDHAVPLAEFKRSTSIHLAENSLSGECKIVTQERTMTATFPTEDPDGQTAETLRPNKLNPFAPGSSEALARMVAGLIDDAGANC
ncbi:hypothetical protein D3C71_451650 [compost metagenome]